MPATRELHLTVITPERKVLEEPADSVVIPAHDGELGILSERAPLLCELGVGQLRYSRGADVRRMVVDGGFAQVFDNRVTVLTSSVTTPEEATDAAIAQAEAAAGAGAAGKDGNATPARERARRKAAALRMLRGAR